MTDAELKAQVDAELTSTINELHLTNVYKKYGPGATYDSTHTGLAEIHAKKAKVAANLIVGQTPIAPPTTTLPVPVGALLYNGDFEDGTLSKWQTNHTDDTSVTGKFEIVPGITPDAKYACRISVPAHTGKARWELESDYYLPEGKTIVYEMVFRIDSDISTAYGHVNINLNQWKVGPVDQASPEPCYTGGIAVLDDGTHFRLYGGQVSPTGSCNYPTQFDTNIGTIPKGRVSRLVVAMKVSKSSDGWVKAWLDNNIVVPLRNQPTMSANVGTYRCRIGLYQNFAFSVPIVVTYGSCKVWEAA